MPGRIGLDLFRWQFFRVHFQFVRADERPHAHDVFRIVCGPVALRERMAHPAAALAAVTNPDSTERHWRGPSLRFPGPHGCPLLPIWAAPRNNRRVDMVEVLARR